MSNVLAYEKRLRVLVALVEGNSELAVERMTGVNARTIARLALKFGEGAARVHNRLVRDLSCSFIEMDEIWSYIGKKQARVDPVNDPPEAGEAYTFVALDTTSRLAISFVVGKRNQETTDAFVTDLRSRFVVMPRLMTSDGFSPYISAIASQFGPACAYAMMSKNYTKSGRRDDDHRYEPPREPFITKRSVFGTPDLDLATTAHVERNNGTMRHHIGRMRRLVYAFSKKIEHHRAAVALNYTWYNLAGVVKSLRTSPAIAAGVSDHIWSPEEFMDAVLAEPENAPPVAKPLAHRAPEGTARELRGGRGWLRVVQGGKDRPGPTPQPSAAAPAATPVQQEPAPTTAPEDEQQLDLLTWRPKTRKMTQMSLFGDDLTMARLPSSSGVDDV